MTVSAAQAQAYIPFPVAVAMRPTDAEWDEWIAAAEIHFQATNDVAFDVDDVVHYDLLMRYVQEALVEWHIGMMNQGTSGSADGVSVLLRTKTTIHETQRRLERTIATGLLAAAMARTSPG